MITVNEHYYKLKAGYLFPEISKRVKAFSDKNADADIIKLGIGDVTEPLVPAVVEAMHGAVDEMSRAESFRGYGPEQGYDFLAEKIIENDYRSRGVEVDRGELFISDGSKCDTGNFQEILSGDNRVAVMDPVYPVYVDTNVMAGRTGGCDSSGRYEGLVYLPCREENGFVPELPAGDVDVIYLCYPNNPTGTVASKEQLNAWVDYAREHKSLILFDSAYEAFISDDGVPHSIYEVEGAREVAVEFRSFSKTAGFTGLRCAYTVVPKGLKVYKKDGSEADLNGLWNRRHCTKFNGVSFVTQRGAEAVYSDEGKRQVRDVISLYMGNAAMMRESLGKLGFTVYGGVNAPYIWLKTAEGADSWEFFDTLLEKANVVGTPGSGFGSCGEGYFRLSAFNNPAKVREAMDRLEKIFG